MQPEGYLSREDIWNLANTFKYYALFNKDLWHLIDEDIENAEKLYNESFFLDKAADGMTNIINRTKKIWSCETDGYHDVRILQNV